ncbi:hypothetical protein P7C70_g6927, partial [Phenoliferia sp. Uapishka_3]
MSSPAVDDATPAPTPAPPELDVRVSSLAHLRSIGPLCRQNEKAWFPAMEHTLEAHQVLPFLQARVEDEPSLLEDASNRNTVIAYQSDLALVCHLLDTNCGPEAMACIVKRNPRASWRRLRRQFIVGDWEAGLRRMQHWMACRYEEGDKFEAWLRKMAILREQVMSYRQDDGPPLTDGFCRDVLLANLPRALFGKLQVDRSSTTLDEVVRQLKRFAVAAGEVIAKEEYDPIGDSVTDDRAPSPPLSLSSDEAEVRAYYSRHTADYDAAEAFYKQKRNAPMLPILQLPPEILRVILLSLLNFPTHVQSSHHKTLFRAIIYQRNHLRLRLVCRSFADALGSPTGLAIRNLTKLRNLIALLKLHPERCERIRNVVLNIQDPNRMRFSAFPLGRTLKAFFNMCPNITTLHVRGTLMLDHDRDGNADDPWLPLPKNSSLLHAISQHLRLREFSLMDGGACVYHKFLDSQPHLTRLAMNEYMNLSRDILKLEPTILNVSIGGSYGPSCMERLSELESTGALANLQTLTLFDMQIPDDDNAEVARFIVILKGIAPRLRKFAFSTLRTYAAPVGVFDTICPLFTSTKSLTLPFKSYTSLSFISNLPRSCETLVLLGPDVFSHWYYMVEELGQQLRLVEGIDEGKWKLDVILCLQNPNGYSSERFWMLNSQLRTLLTAFPGGKAIEYRKRLWQAPQGGLEAKVSVW